MSKKFKRILIANRGEIAIRVMKTCREMGIETVSIFTDKEKDLPHATFGDINVSLGTGTLADTYLNISLLVDICKKYQIDAVHPGYGFLSENALFSKTLDENGVILIGPPTRAMEIMGDKKTSKQELEKINSPLIPGYHGENQDPSFLKEQASKIGYPVLIKASAGGGGKGMRIVRDVSDFDEALNSAKREAMNAFKSDIVLIEKYIQNPRHIEVQVLSDSHGNHFHLFERECSIQRRHQKIIEESPSPSLDEKTRSSITKTAVEISKHIDYRGAGTVEFIYDEDGSFYFLEMNTRLQVEHPVTEMVTGVDLVREQILIAQGDKISFKQEELKQNGHSIEVRLYAEDPDNSFLPSIGKITSIGTAKLNNVRLDTGYIEGSEVTIDFDPMLAKLIVKADNRDLAIEKMIQSVKDVPFLGVKTNSEYLIRVLNHSTFKKGETFTHFIETYESDLQAVTMSDETKADCLASFLLTEKFETMSNSPWTKLVNFRNT